MPGLQASRRFIAAGGGAHRMCRCLSSGALRQTQLVRALEKVEVAHMRSYQQPTPSLRQSQPSSRSAPSATWSRLSPAHVSPAVTATAAAALGTGSRRTAAEESYASMDLTLMADDSASPAPTRNNGAIVARSLGGSIAAAERFFFRQATGTRAGEGGDGADEDSDSGAGACVDWRRRGENGRGTVGGGGDAIPEFHFCALCREEIDPAVMSPRQHILSDSRASHTNHNCREVVLDSLALLSMRGYPIDHIYEVWSTTLFHHNAFGRVRSWVRPWWSVERRAAQLFKLLEGLKAAGVIDLALAGVTPNETGAEAYHHRRRVAYERLEYIGDNAWGTHVSTRIMLLFPDQQWAYSERAYAFNCFRDAVEMNITNELMFDTLHLEKLFPPEQQAKLGNGKMKADTVEALIGELHWALWSYEPKLYDDVGYVEVNGAGEDGVVAVLEHCLTELYDLIVLGYCRELSWNAIPLAKELAARFLWKGVVPPLKTQKSFARSSPRSARGWVIAAANGSEPSPTPALTPAGPTVSSLGPVHTLPATPVLFTEPTGYPAQVPHPLRAQTLEELPPDTRNTLTGADVFAEHVSSYRRLRLLSDDAHQIFEMHGPGREGRQGRREARAPPPRWDELVAQFVPALAIHAAVSSASALPMAAHSHAGELEKSFFVDPYYRLFAAARPSTRPEAPRPRVWGSMVLPTVTARSPLVGREEWLAFLSASTYPPLQSAPEGETATGDGAGVTDRGVRAVAGSYAPSRLVPAGVRPPSAGVVTDKNLYRGLFAYLGYRPRDRAQRAYSAAEEGPLSIYLRRRDSMAAAATATAAAAAAPAEAVLERVEEVKPAEAGLVPASEEPTASAQDTVSSAAVAEGVGRTEASPEKESCESAAGAEESPEELIAGAMKYWLEVNEHRRASREFESCFQVVRGSLPGRARDG